MRMKDHATARCQQRGIKGEVVDAILAFGTRQYRHGAEVCFMDHRSRRTALKALGPKHYARIADRLDSYLVVSNDGAVMTAARRMRRLKF